MIKKGFTLLLAGYMALMLTACGSPGSLVDALNSANSDSADQDSVEDTSFSGYLGDTLSTKFFEFTVDSAQVANSYEDSVPGDGMQFLVVNLTIHNTSTYSMPMLSDDFQIQWGSGDEDYGWPVAGSLCTDYEIAINDIVAGDLVFEVPEGTKDYSVSFLEYFEDGTEGDSFFIYFTADSAVAA